MVAVGYSEPVFLPVHRECRHVMHETVRGFKLWDVISFYCQIEFDEAVVDRARGTDAAQPMNDGVIFRQDNGAEGAEAELFGADEQDVEERGAEAEALNLVDHGEGDFSDAGILGEANKASDAEAGFAGEGGIDCDPGDVVALVHFGEILKEAWGEFLRVAEEAQVARFGGEEIHAALNAGFVLGPNWPNVGARAVAQLNFKSFSPQANHNRHLPGVSRHVQLKRVKAQWCESGKGKESCASKRALKPKLLPNSGGFW